MSESEDDQRRDAVLRRMLATPKGGTGALGAAEKAAVREALDMLGLALTAHKHVWTDAERPAYERAIELLS